MRSLSFNFTNLSMSVKFMEFKLKANYVCTYMVVTLPTYVYYTIIHTYVGVPPVVPHLSIVGNAVTNGHSITLTLSWGEPFNNLDPIVNYTVSCSGDVACPSNFTTTTRSYTITNLTTMTNYTFSVVATNSIGSGEAGVVMITTPPGM